MAALDGRFHCAYCVLAVPYPNFPDKHLATPLVTPQRFLEYARASGRLEGFEPPKGVLLIYKRSLMASLVESHAAQEETCIPQLTSAYRLPRTGGAVGLLGDFGIGGPVVSILVEEHAALDVRYFFSLGLAGGLQSDGRIGDIVLCTRAIRDEGVSHHYLPADVEAMPSRHFTEAIARELDATNSEIARASARFLTEAAPAVAASELQKLTKDMAAQANTEIRSERILPPVERGEILEIPVEIAVSGEIRQLVDLLSRLEAAPKLLTVQDLRVRVVNVSQPKELLATLTISGYILPGKSKT